MFTAVFVTINLPTLTLIPCGSDKHLPVLSQHFIVYINSQVLGIYGNFSIVLYTDSVNENATFDSACFQLVVSLSTICNRNRTLRSYHYYNIH